MKSKASSPYTTVAALAAADRILGPERVWNAVSDAQTAWLDRFVRLKTELGAIHEIKTNATFDPADHAAFLQKNGWEPQIKEARPDEFLLAGVMDVIGKWLKEGARAWISPKGGFDAATVTRGADVLVRKGTGERVVRVETREGDIVWIEMVPSAPDGVDLALEANARFSGAFDADRDLCGVTFPLIDFAGKADFEWLKDLWTVTERGTDAKILEAKQGTELKVSKAGFRARAADEMRGVEESAEEEPTPFVIDRPFLLSVSRPGLSLPLFTAHLAEDAWKDPGTIA